MNIFMFYHYLVWRNSAGRKFYISSIVYYIMISSDGIPSYENFYICLRYTVISPDGIPSDESFYFSSIVYVILLFYNIVMIQQ